MGDWFIELFGPLMLWLESLVSGPDAVWRRPFGSLIDLAVWLDTGWHRLVIVAILLVIVLWRVLRR